MNPCETCSCKPCSGRDFDIESCPFDPTARQLEVIKRSDYSVMNVDTKKEASNIIQSIMEGKKDGE